MEVGTFQLFISNFAIPVSQIIGLIHLLRICCDTPLLASLPTMTPVLLLINGCLLKVLTMTDF